MSKNTKADMYVDIVALHSEVTGSCNICTVRLPDQRKLKFIVDCGLFQEEKYQKENYYLPFDPKEIDFALVTHNHIDHIGRIPKLYKDGFEGPTFASTTTSELMTYALNNTAEIFEAALSQNQGKVRRAMQDSSIPVYLSNLMSAPLFDKDDVSYAMDNVYGLEFNRRVKINPNVSVMFAQNGHLLGASSILVTISYPGQRSINLFFSGDLAKTNMGQEQAKVAQTMQNYQSQMDYANNLYNQLLQERQVMRSIYGDMYEDEYKHMQRELEIWADNLQAETARYAQQQETARNNAKIAADKYAADAGLRLQKYMDQKNAEAAKAKNKPNYLDDINKVYAQYQSQLADLDRQTKDFGTYLNPFGSNGMFGSGLGLNSTATQAKNLRNKGFEDYLYQQNPYLQKMLRENYSDMLGMYGIGG